MKKGEVYKLEGFYTKSRIVRISKVFKSRKQAMVEFLHTDGWFMHYIPIHTYYIKRDKYLNELYGEKD